jgi:hypothetical protein
MLVATGLFSPVIVFYDARTPILPFQQQNLKKFSTGSVEVEFSNNRSGVPKRPVAIEVAGRFGCILSFIALGACLKILIPW